MPHPTPLRALAARAAPWLALAAVLAVEVAHMRTESPQCGGVCTMLEQARAYTHGGDPWTGQTMDGAQPACPTGISSMYSPASLWLLSALSDHVDAVCRVWRGVQLAAYGVALAAAMSLVTCWRRRVAMMALVLWVRGGLGDPFFRDSMTGNVASLEAAGVWTVAALGARSRWWSLVAVAFATGVQKQVYWALAAIPLLARRVGPTAAALGAMGALHLTMGVLDRHGYAKWLVQARSHDERGLIHPSLRSLSHDLMEGWGAPPSATDLPWLAVCLGVGAWLWWDARRAPERVATGVGMLRVVLAYLAVTPYLKDYTLVVAVPAVAAALVSARTSAAVAVALALVLGTWLGEYHALALIWAALWALGWPRGPRQGDGLAGSEKVRLPAVPNDPSPEAQP